MVAGPSCMYWLDVSFHTWHNEVVNDSFCFRAHRAGNYYIELGHYVHVGKVSIRLLRSRCIQVKVPPVIESDILSFVSDIVLTPPPNNLYNAIKARLIKQFTDSDSKKLHSLLNDLQIGDMKPSNLLRKMRELSCGKVGEDLLKVLWLQKLPTTIQAILSTNTNPLEQLSSLADTMFEVVECSSVQAVSSTQTSQFNDLVNAVYKLDGKIESLKKQFRAPSKSSKTASRSRTPTPTKVKFASTTSDSQRKHENVLHLAISSPHENQKTRRPFKIGDTEHRP